MTPAPALQSDLSDLLNRATPDNAACVILAAIKILSQEARTYTGRTLAYGLGHDDFLALSRVVSTLSANRTAFSYRARALVPGITQTATNGCDWSTKLTRPALTSRNSVNTAFGL
jgi:hypothetical protein